MLGFNAKGILSRRAKKEGEPSPGAVAETTRTQTAEKLIVQRRQISFGRSLSFVINENSIEMSAVSRMGRSMSLLGIRKVYFPGSKGNAEELDSFIAQSISIQIQKIVPKMLTRKIEPIITR